MIRNYGDALNALAERTYDNTQAIKRMKTQRRVSFVDLYGIPFSVQGDANYPATFYISMSPDLVYYERFAFKVVIESFQSTVTGVDGGSITIGNTSLSGGGTYSADIIDGTSTLDDSSSSGGITPNPHTHPVSGELGGLTYGIKKQATASTNWRMKIHGIDITPYLMEQQDGEWINGEGIFPSKSLKDEEDMYDILDVACMFEAEGDTDSRNKLLLPEFKQVQILSDAPFKATVHLYLKYSHMNR